MSFIFDDKLPNGFASNMPWDEDRISKASKDLKKFQSTLEKHGQEAKIHSKETV